MGDPYTEVTWGHYYHIGGGSFIHSYQYPPPASFIPVAFQPGFYGGHVSQVSYGYYQPGWYQAFPGPSELEKNPGTSVTINKDCSEQEPSAFASESHDPTPMDISPNVSPVKQPSQPLARCGTARSFQPNKYKCTKSTCTPTENVLPCSTSRTATSCIRKTENTAKIQCSDLSPTALSMLVLEKCSACLSRTLVQAKGTSSVKLKPCTCVQRPQECELKPQEGESIKRKSPKTSAQAAVMSECHNKFVHIKNSRETNVAISTEPVGSRVVGSVSNLSRHAVPHILQSVASHPLHVEHCVSGSGASRSRHVEPCVSGSGASRSRRVEPCVSGSGASRSRRVEPCVSGSGAAQSRRVEPCVSGSGAAQSRHVEPCVSGSDASRSRHVEPRVSGSGASRSRHVEPRVSGSGASRSQHVEPCVSGSDASRFRHVEPCVSGSGAGRSRHVEPCVSGPGASRSRHVEPSVLGSDASRSRRVEPIMTKPSFDQHLREGDGATNTAVIPRRRAIVRRINGVARIFAVSARSPLKQKTEYTLIGKATVQPVGSPMSHPMEKVIPIPEKSSKHEFESKSCTQDIKKDKQFGRPIGHRKSVKAHRDSGNVRLVPEKLERQHGRSARRKRYRWRQKLRKTDGLSPASATEACTDELSPGALCLQEKSNSVDLTKICDVGSKEPVHNRLHSSKKCSVLQCVQTAKAVSKATISCSLSVNKIPVVNDADSTRLSCEGQPQTSDVLCSEKPVIRDNIKIVSGIYVPRQVINFTVTTCTGIEVDPILGGCEEHGDGPFELQSQLEKLDEGWMWSFD